MNTHVIKQFSSVFANNLKSLHRDRLLLWIIFLFPWFATSLLQAVSYSDVTGSRYLFFCIIFCFWFMLHIGIRLIIQEKNIIKREFYVGLSRPCYLMAKFVFYLLISGYIAIVFSIGVNINLLDWNTIETLKSGYFIQDKEDFINFEFPEKIQHVEPGSDEYRKLYKQHEKITDYRQAIESYRNRPSLLFNNMLFVYKTDFRYFNPFNTVPFRPIKIQNAKNQGDCSNSQAEKSRYLKNWCDYPYLSAEHIAEIRRQEIQFSFSERFIQLLVAILYLDYSLIIFFLAGLCGLSLGLLISTLSPSLESAAQFVPYITIFQILMSKEIKQSLALQHHFDILQAYHLTDILTQWNLGDILSLLSISRYLSALANHLLVGEHSFSVGWMAFFYLNDLYIIIGWIALTTILTGISLKKI